jgi:hypothetical protein
MRVGDTVRVEGTDVGCQVAEEQGETMMECRRLTRPEGTYGTFIGNRRALAARYRSSSTAQIVFTARQRGGWRACRTRTSELASAAAAAQRGCR